MVPLREEKGADLFFYSKTMREVRIRVRKIKLSPFLSLFYSDKQLHVNWWDRTGGPKRSDWVYGASKVEGKGLNDLLDILQHFPKR